MSINFYISISDMFKKIFAGFLLILFSPVLLITYIAVKSSSNGPFIFKQLRTGKNRKPFYIYKIRTMVERAESIKEKYQHLNEADGPVFKIRNDPRYTKIGKILSYTGIDELPQLINILKGEMNFVGPRPFPLDEANKISDKYKHRFTVLPGITSLWVINGSHTLSFTEWMKLDLEYIKRKSILMDIKIIILTIFTIIQGLFKTVKSYKKNGLLKRAH